MMMMISFIAVLHLLLVVLLLSPCVFVKAQDVTPTEVPSSRPSVEGFVAPSVPEDELQEPQVQIEAEEMVAPSMYPSLAGEASEDVIITSPTAPKASTVQVESPSSMGNAAGAVVEGEGSTKTKTKKSPAFTPPAQVGGAMNVNEEVEEETQTALKSTIYIFSSLVVLFACVLVAYLVRCISGVGSSSSDSSHLHHFASVQQRR